MSIASTKSKTNGFLKSYATYEAELLKRSRDLKSFSEYVLLKNKSPAKGTSNMTSSELNFFEEEIQNIEESLSAKILLLTSLAKFETISNQGENLIKALNKVLEPFNIIQEDFSSSKQEEEEEDKPKTSSSKKIPFAQQALLEPKTPVFTTKKAVTSTVNSNNNNKNVPKSSARKRLRSTGVAPLSNRRSYYGEEKSNNDDDPPTPLLNNLSKASLNVLSRKSPRLKLWMSDFLRIVFVVIIMYCELK